jgi:hypothetical protein
MNFAKSRLEDFDKYGAIWTINYEQAHPVLPNTLKNLHIMKSLICSQQVFYPTLLKI